jgi:hypothetical protein
MSILHTILIFILSSIFLTAVLFTIIKGKMRVRYSLLWLSIGVMAFCMPVLYRLSQYLHNIWYFPTPSVLLLMLAVVALALICLQITTVISGAWRERKNLAQHIALLERRIDSLEQTELKSFAPDETASRNAVQDLTSKSRM